MKLPEEQLEYLKGFVTDYKNELFGKLIQERTDYITIVLEDLYQSHNMSAVMRSAECLGVQNIHTIENRNVYDETSTVSHGAREWLTLHRHKEMDDNTLATIEELRSQGYRIIATTPHKDDQLIDDLDLGKGKMAFFMGTERWGVSKTVIDQADEFVKVPMYGFTESLNVSVCAAILMYSVVQRLHQSGINWQLPEKQKIEVLLEWYKKTVRSSDEVLGRFLQEKQ